jgi:tetratricopeptide (TPR) repeat protein
MALWPRFFSSQCIVPGLAGSVALITLLGVPGLTRGHGGHADRVAALDAQIEAAPGNAMLWVDRAAIHLDHTDFEAALADLDRAAELDTGLAEIEAFRGRVLLQMGRVSQADAALVRALALRPGDVPVLLVRARVREALQQPIAAAADYSAVIALAARPGPEPYLERARVLIVAGERHWEEALAGLEQGRERLGSLLALELAALELELRLERVDAALQRLERATAHFARQEHWLVRRAEILLSAGRSDEAYTAYAEALERIQDLPGHLKHTAAVESLYTQAQAAMQKLRPEAGGERG